MSLRKGEHLWFWVQPHCSCGWIGTEVDGITETSIRKAEEEIESHRVKHEG